MSASDILGGMARPDKVPPVQLDPTLLPSGQAWEYGCTYRRGGFACRAVLQGGLAGVRAHWLTVHADRAIPNWMCG